MSNYKMILKIIKINLKKNKFTTLIRMNCYKIKFQHLKLKYKIKIYHSPQKFNI